jgi:hypothetical protein
LPRASAHRLLRAPHLDDRAVISLYGKSPGAAADVCSTAAGGVVPDGAVHIPVTAQEAEAAAVIAANADQLDTDSRLSGPGAPQPVRGPLGFPVSFTPSRYRPRMSRWGQVTDTTRGHVADMAPTSKQRNPLTTCDLTSHPHQSSCRGHQPRPTAIGKSGCHLATHPHSNASEQPPTP